MCCEAEFSQDTRSSKVVSKRKFGSHKWYWKETWSKTVVTGRKVGPENSQIMNFSPSSLHLQIHLLWHHDQKNGLHYTLEDIFWWEGPFNLETLKSISPLPSLSNFSKICSTNCEAFFSDRTARYICFILSLLKVPSGLSSMKPLKKVFNVHFGPRCFNQS